MIPLVQKGTAGGSAAFTADGKGLFYTRYPAGGERPKEDLDFYQQVFFHALGTPVSADRYAFGKDLPRIAEIVLRSSDDGRRHLAARPERRQRRLRALRPARRRGGMAEREHVRRRHRRRAFRPGRLDLGDLEEGRAAPERPAASRGRPHPRRGPDRSRAARRRPRSDRARALTPLHGRRARRQEPRARVRPRRRPPRGDSGAGRLGGRRASRSDGDRAFYTVSTFLEPRRVRLGPGGEDRGADRRRAEGRRRISPTPRSSRRARSPRTGRAFRCSSSSGRHEARREEPGPSHGLRRVRHLADASYADLAHV